MRFYLVIARTLPEAIYNQAKSNFNDGIATGEILHYGLLRLCLAMTQWQYVIARFHLWNRGNP